MINPKSLLTQLFRLHDKQSADENWPTLQFEDNRAVFTTHVSADGFGRGVGLRFAVPVDQRPRFGALPAALPEGVFSVKEMALKTLKASVGKEAVELLRIELTIDNGSWASFRVGVGGIVELQRVSTGVVYPMSAMGERTPMAPEILHELLRLKEVVKLNNGDKGTPVTPNSFQVLVRLGPSGAESADTHRMVIRSSACWPEDLWLSGAHLQRAHVLVRKDNSAKLSATGGYVLLTGQNWELAMPKMTPDEDYPDVSGIVRARVPATARITVDVDPLVAFLQAGRTAAASMAAKAPLFVLCMVDGRYVPEYSATYVTDSDKTPDVQRPLPLDPWVRPELKQEILLPDQAPKRFGINPTYLTDAVRYVGTTTLVMDIGPDLTPAFLHSGDRTGVVMPCRLDRFLYEMDDVLDEKSA